jgi:hypothetical protein
MMSIVSEVQMKPHFQLPPPGRPPRSSAALCDGAQCCCPHPNNAAPTPQTNSCVN